MEKAANNGSGRVPNAGGSAFPVPKTASNLSKTEGYTDNPKPVPSWKGPPSEKTNAGSGDPFSGGVSITHSTGGVKLSAGAPDFEPAGPSTFNAPRKPSQLAILSRYSVQDIDNDEPTIVQSSAGANGNKTNGKAVQKPIGTRGDCYSPVKKVYFTTDMGPGVPFTGGHYLKMEHVPVSEVDRRMSALYNEFGWHGKLNGQKAPHSNDAKKFLTLYLCFDDTRDAASAEDEVSLIASNWDVTYISHQEYAAAGALTSLGTQDQTSFHDGQVLFVATFEGTMSEIDTAGVTDAVRDVAKEFGEILAFLDAAQPHSPAWEFRVEFYKVSNAKAAIRGMASSHPRSFKNWSITAKPMSDVLAAETGNTMTVVASSAATPQKLAQGPGGLYCSPTGRTVWSFDANGQAQIERPAKQVPKCYGSAAVPGVEDTPQRDRMFSEPAVQTPSPFGAIPTDLRSNSWNGHVAVYHGRNQSYGDNEPQAVNTHRINAGQDVRTTIMLRNLPNKWTIHQLRNILDKTCKGKYDFAYLRIDFAFNTNVGYAFVNFIDASYIIDFVHTHVGKEWQPGSVPRKIGQISYATIQGIDCLIEKFRNSAVMDEFPDYRPKLIYSEETAPEPGLISTERPFPAPNNLSKKQRSHDNAGQIGLYAPRSGHRGGDRHHRSQYDRGTPAQIQEDSFYNQSPLGSPGFGYNDFRYAGGSPRFPMGQVYYANAMVDPAYFDGMGFGPVFPGHAPYGTGPYTPVRRNGPSPRFRNMSKGRISGRCKTVAFDGEEPAKQITGDFNGWSFPANGSSSHGLHTLTEQPEDGDGFAANHATPTQGANGGTFGWQKF